MQLKPIPSGAPPMRALVVDDSASSLANLTRLVEEACALTCVPFTDPYAALDAAATGALTTVRPYKAALTDEEDRFGSASR